MSPQIIQAAEIVGTFFGLVSVYLLTMGNGRGWSLGMIWIVLTGLVFASQNLYGSAGLQVFFLVTQVEGWRRWRQGEGEDLRRSSANLSSWNLLLILTLLGASTAVGTMILGKAEGQSPLFDSFVTSGSILAQLLMIRGYRECWLFWFAVDVVYVYVTFKAKLMAFLGLYLVFCVLAMNGWRQWTRDLEE